MAKKKKPAANPNRGFATTSLPSKSKPQDPLPAEEPPPEEPAEQESPEQPEEFVVPSEEELEQQELQKIVDKHGPKVRREAQRVASKCETDKRTLRLMGACYPLKLDRVFGLDDNRFGGQLPAAENGNRPPSLGEELLQLAQEEYEEQGRTNSRRTADEDGLLAQCWTLHRGLLALGFPQKRVEEALATYVKTGEANDKTTEDAMDEVFQWMALYCPTKELPKMLDETPLGAGKKVPSTRSPAPSGLPTPSDSGTSTPRLESNGEKRHKPLTAGSSKPQITPTALLTEISNLQLETKDISDQGEEDEMEEEAKDEDEDEEDTPETLIPRWVKHQSRLHRIHPSLSATISRKNFGKGKKGSKSKATALPSGLSPEKMKEVKKLQEKLTILERDPLFDQYTADEKWAPERQRLEEERLSCQKEKPARTASSKTTALPTPRETSTPTNESQNPDEDGTLGLMGSLFEGPPSEEPVLEGESVTVRDFEGPLPASSNFGGKGGKSKGKSGVGAASMRKIIEEICKARDSSARVRFETVPGTAISHRSRLSILSTSPSPISTKQDVLDEDAEVLIKNPSPNNTVFEMQKLAAATKEQAEGYLATFALFRLFSKKEEKLYLRLPTIWRNVWAEFVEADTQQSYVEERKVLRRLKGQLSSNAESPINGSTGTRSPRQNSPSGRNETDGEATAQRKAKPGYARYLEGEQIQEDWNYRRQRPSYLQMEEYRQHLPMWNFRQEILKSVESSNVVVVCGETGCGKSTQLPAFLLEDELSHGRPCKIYCTEPRRISAISLARRVSEELGERKNEVGTKSSLVGYAIRLESAVHEGTRLVYATTGIVMRMLERQPDLEEVTHLILDEVHERSIESDFLLVVLKRLLVKRKDLKVVLMSATVDAERFSDYLGGAPILNVPGRTYPVQSYFLEDAVEATAFVVEDDGRRSKFRKDESDDNDAELEDLGSAQAGNLQGYRPETRTTLARMEQHRISYELILKLLETIATAPQYIEFSKAILVFLPGLNEIRRVNDMLLGHPLFGPDRNGVTGWMVVPLHSTIASEEQELAFHIPPSGMRKIVLATNIAETGITIPDVTAVIDTGKHKEMRFDEKRQLSRLIETFISRANAKQRRGRAGRVQEGICFHLFTKSRYETAMADQQTPEIMRLSLQDLVLRVKICGLGNAEEVLTTALDSPTPKNIRRAVDSLVEVKALTATEELTYLGRQLAKLPLDVYLGKLVLLGVVFGTLDAAITIAAILSSKSPFVAPMGQRGQADQARLGFKRGDSDLLTGWNAYESWRRVCSDKVGNISETEFCRKNFLSGRTLSGVEDLKGQLFAAVIDAGFLTLNPAEQATLNRSRFATYRRKNFFIPPEHVNRNSDNDTVVNAAIAGGFYPKVIQREGKGWKNVGSGKVVMVGRSSVNKETTSEWLSYYGLMQVGTKYSEAHETSHVDELAILLLCGEVEFKMYAGIAVVDGRTKFSFRDWKSMIVVRILRTRVREFLAKAFKNPGREMGEREALWLGFLDRVLKAGGSSGSNNNGSGKGV